MIWVVAEIARPQKGHPEHLETIWHAAVKRRTTTDFAPIRCSPNEGIVAHARLYRNSEQAITCPDCLRVLNIRRQP